MHRVRDAALIALGTTAALGAFVGAVAVSPQLCPGLGGEPSWFTPASLSFVVVGGVLALGTALFALVRFGQRPTSYWDVAWVTGLVLVVVGIAVLVAGSQQPTC